MTKTATIKLRLSDDEKANWEAQADADGVTLSSLIRHRMNHPTTRADGGLETAPTAFVVSRDWFDSTQIIEATDINPERRLSTCEHGRPQYVFCPTCDA